MSVGAIGPASAAPPLEEVVDAMACLVESGLVVSGSAGGFSHQALQDMIDLMVDQYEHETGVSNER
jgi:hypothetical protein